MASAVQDYARNLTSGKGYFDALDTFMRDLFDFFPGQAAPRTGAAAAGAPQRPNGIIDALMPSQATQFAIALFLIGLMFVGAGAVGITMKYTTANAASVVKAVI